MRKETYLNSMGGKKPLSPMELEFMELVWKSPEGIRSEKVYEFFPQARGTKSTVLYNLSQKGYLEKQQEGLHYIYKPLVKKEEYQRALIQQRLEETFGDSSFERLVAAFCGKRELTSEQQEKLHALLKELRESLDEDPELE